MSTVTLRGRLHNVLIQHGYKREPSSKYLYSQKIRISGIEFHLNLCINDPFFEKLPTAYLKEIPKELPGNLPHLLRNLKLCYLDSSSVYLDRYDIEGNMFLVINLISSLLHQYVSHPEQLQNEFRRELSYYWRSELYDLCYLITNKTKNLKYSIFNRNSLASEDGELEIVIGENHSQILQWKKKRGEKETTSNGVAFIITLPDDVTIPESPWPPTSFVEVIDWLKKNNGLQSANKLIDDSASAITTHKNFIVIFKLGTIQLGLIILPTRSSYIATLKKALERKGKKRVKIDQKLKLIKMILSIGKFTFARVWIDNSSVEYITHRNIPDRKGLGKLKIAQIGCGTVGGNSAHMLVQSGAGTEGGCLDLYDSDTFRPENLGRHLLGVSYIGENKATAMTDWIKKNHVSAICINSVEGHINAISLINHQKKYDLIIDATGNYKFSTSLSHHMRRSKKITPIIHGWVDALGLVARTLMDDGKKDFACYYCITGNHSKNSSNNLFKAGVEIPKWQPESCGLGSFIPFSSQASSCVASLVQGTCLDWINGNPSPRYRHITIDYNRVHDRKNKNVKSIDGCQCCQDIENV